jgi:hypothetical protein
VKAGNGVAAFAFTFQNTSYTGSNTPQSRGVNTHLHQPVSITLDTSDSPSSKSPTIL